MSNCLLVGGCVSQLNDFPKISGLCQELAHAQDLRDTLLEVVYIGTFLLVMYDQNYV